MTKLSNTKTLILAALASTVLAGMALPSLASANCYDRKHDAGTNGAVAGAIVGGAIGGSSSGHRSKGTGTVAGALVGAVVGSSIARDNTKCGYDNRGYDNRGYDNRGYAPRGGVVIEDRTGGYDRRDDHRGDSNWIWRAHDHRWERRDGRGN